MISWSVEDRIAELVLNRAPCNEIGSGMLAALEGFLEAFDPADAGALVIRSAQPAGFSAGADLRELYGEIADRPAAEWVDELREFVDRIHSVMDRFDAMPLTTVGVVHGVCFGGGFELALTTDIRIAEKSARFSFPELRLGIVPGFGGIPRLRRDVGNAVVRDLLMTGRSLNAKRAVDVGIASQMVPRGRGRAVALGVARQAAKYDSGTTARAKSFMKPLLADELRDEKRIFVEMFQRSHVREALAAFCASTDVRPYLA